MDWNCGFGNELANEQTNRKINSYDKIRVTSGRLIFSSFHLSFTHWKAKPKRVLIILLRMN